MAGFNADIPGLHDLDSEYIAYTNAPTLLTQVGTLLGVTAVVVTLRCYVRVVMIRSFGKDDWAILLAFAFAIASYITYMVQPRVGLGKHLPVIRMDESGYREFARLRQVQAIIIAVGVGLVKASVAFFLLRLVTNRAYIWFLRGFIVFMASFTAACIGTLVWQCIPVAAAWDLRLRPPPVGSGTAVCFSAKTFTAIGLMNTAVTIATDFLLALLPVPLIWKLQLNRRSKITLVCILTLGLFAGVAAIIKSEQQKTVISDPDPYVKDTFVLWRFIEYYICIIAASLPSLKPLFKQLLNNGTRGAEASNPPPPSRPRYSNRIKLIEDDEIPLEIYGKIGHSAEVSSGVDKTRGQDDDRQDSVRKLDPNIILVEEKWRVS